MLSLGGRRKALFFAVGGMRRKDMGSLRDGGAACISRGRTYALRMDAEWLIGRLDWFRWFCLDTADGAADIPDDQDSDEQYHQRNENGDDGHNGHGINYQHAFNRMVIDGKRDSPPC